MRVNRRTLFRLTPLFLLFAVTFSFVAPVGTTVAAGPQVSEDTATVDFPTKLTFHLVADAPQPVVSVETWYHAAYSPVTSVSRADFGGGVHVDVTSTIDMQLNYLPPGLDIDYRWRLTLQDGSVLETPNQTVLYMDTRYKWKTITQDPVTVYYFPGDESLGKEALDTTIQAINNLRQQFSITADEPVRVVLYGSSSDFASALPPNSAEWIGGFAQPDLHLVVTGVQPGSDATTEIHRVLSHESVHLIVHQATDNPFNTPPPWLDEGLATYYQTVQDPRFPPILQSAVRSGQLIPIRALNSSFPDDPNQALLSYAESESIVQFILTKQGNDRMSALLHAYQGGVSNDQAVQIAFGFSLDELDKQWKAWLGYKGDQQVTATIDPSQDGSHPGQAIDDFVASFGPDIIIGVAALFTIVLGFTLLIRALSTKDESESP
jgi:hypothetical protein